MVVWVRERESGIIFRHFEMIDVFSLEEFSCIEV